jgi:membrane fusion protein (multidrug efflux system)
MCEKMLLSLFPYPSATKIFSASREKLLISCVLISVAILPQTGMAVTPDALPTSLASPYSPEVSTTDTPEYVVIRPSEQVTYSSETAASIDKLTIREGSKFNKGDILLKMDCRLQKAELDKVKAQAELAATAEQSAIKLKSYGSISGLEMAKAHSDAETTNADVEKLSAVVDKCVIKAPFNGAVSDLMVHPLETVKPGDPLFKIISLENLEFEIAIPSAWLKWLKIGSTFNVHLNETDKTVKVTVKRIDPEIESVSQTIKITGVVHTPDTSLLPGMTGQAIFPDNPDGQRLDIRK